MKYLLLIVDVPGAPPLEDPGRDASGWADEMDRRGIRSLGARVRSPEDATTIRVRDGETLVTDGPFAETKKQMVGFDILECSNLDEAIEVASKHPMARAGLVELRPFWTE